jgi:cleavage and polyadenylation specificity factor subunit 4
LHFSKFQHYLTKPRNLWSKYMVDVVPVKFETDLREALEQTDLTTFKFDFEDELASRDAKDPANQISLGDLNGEAEICKFFLKGSCSKGTQCPYRHNRTEKSVVCKHWLRGLCKKGDTCEFLHQYDLSKMPECYFYSKFGECSNPECMYLHINPDDKIRECPWYVRGFCRSGPKCRFKHVKKTTVCENYLIGFCPLGPNCKFGHPKWEIPKEESQSKQASASRTSVVCHKCGQIGHKAAQCPKFPQQVKPIPTYASERTEDGKRPIETVTCYKCGLLGHYANKCPNKIRAGPYEGDANLTVSNVSQNVTNINVLNNGLLPSLQQQQQLPPGVSMQQ